MSKFGQILSFCQKYDLRYFCYRLNIELSMRLFMMLLKMWGES